MLYPAISLFKFTLKTHAVFRGEVDTESMSLNDINQRIVFTGTEPDCLLYIERQSREGVADLSVHELTFVIEPVSISQVYQELRQTKDREGEA